MTKSISRSQMRLIASTNAIFGADEACAMLRISRDAMYRLTNMPQTCWNCHKAIKPLFFNRGERKAINSKAPGPPMAIWKENAYFRFQRSASLVGISSSSNSPR